MSLHFETLGVDHSKRENRISLALSLPAAASLTKELKAKVKEYLYGTSNASC